MQTPMGSCCQVPLSLRNQSNAFSLPLCTPPQPFSFPTLLSIYIFAISTLVLKHAHTAVQPPDQPLGAKAPVKLINQILPVNAFKPFRVLLSGSRKVWDPPGLWNIFIYFLYFLIPGDGTSWFQLASHPLKATSKGATVSLGALWEDPSLCMLRSSLPSVLGSHW